MAVPGAGPCHCRGFVTAAAGDAGLRLCGAASRGFLVLRKRSPWLLSLYISGGSGGILDSRCQLTTICSHHGALIVFMFAVQALGRALFILRLPHQKSDLGAIPSTELYLSCVCCIKQSVSLCPWRRSVCLVFANPNIVLYCVSPSLSQFMFVLRLCLPFV